MTPAEYTKWRDSVLIQDNPRTFHEFCELNGVRFSNPISEEIARHKVITTAIKLPEELRQKSHNWLISQGYESWM